MKTPRVAICFAGLPYYIDHNKRHWLEVIERYNADVYASLWSDEEEKYNKGDTVKSFIDTYKPIKVETERHEDFQKNSFGFLAEEYNKHPSCFENDKQLTEPAVRDAHLAGRAYSSFYKVWRANALKSSIGREYDIVVKAETCSSYPNLQLEALDIFTEGGSEYRASDRISLPYWNHIVNYWGGRRSVLNNWLAFGPPDLIDYYCSVFLYLRKYYEEAIIQPPENFITHHLTNRPSIKLRFFYNKMFRKGKLAWNGSVRGWKDTSGEVKRTSFYSTTANLGKDMRGSLEDLYDADDITPQKMESVVNWPNGRPLTEKSVFLEEDYLRKSPELVWDKFFSHTNQIDYDQDGNIIPIA
tara:strand:- start:1452 stop:2519 length:1068 start_codon:yes stop_codon:yes gene_type:complete